MFPGSDGRLSRAMNTLPLSLGLNSLEERTRQERRQNEREQSLRNNNNSTNSRLSSGREIKHRGLRVGVTEGHTLQSLTKRQNPQSSNKKSREDKITDPDRVTTRRNCTVPLECV